MKYPRTWKALFSLFALIGLVILAGAGAAIASPQAEVDLAIELMAPQHVEPGGEYVLNVAYRNAGFISSPEDTWVRLTLPAGASFVSAQDAHKNALPPDVVDGNVLTWQVGSISADSVNLHIYVTVQATAELVEGASLSSKGEIGTSAVESNLENNTFILESTICDMAGSTKQAQAGEVKPGDVLTYTITLRLAERTGPGAANVRDVDLTDFLPPTTQARFLGWVGEQANATYDGAQLHWQGKVRAGEPLVLQYRLGIEGDVPPGDPITNRAHLSWNGGEMDLEPVTVQAYLGENDRMFGPQGGQWQLQFGLTVDVPQNAVQEQTRFEFRPLFEETPPVDAPGGLLFAHRAFTMNAFQFGEVHQFAEPLTFTLRFGQDDVAGLNGDTLRLWYRSSAGEPWAMLAGPQQIQNGQITVQTDHLTEFALFAQGANRIYLPMARK